MMAKPGQFSLMCLFVEVSLIAAVIGLFRGAVVSWGHSPFVAGFMLGAALVLLGGAYGLLRWMMGAGDLPDSPQSDLQKSADGKRLRAGDPPDWPPPQV